MWLYIAIVLAVLWFAGLLSHIGGGLIHLLIVVAVISLIVHLVSGRRSGV